jgi:hypothetical protein
MKLYGDKSSGYYYLASDVKPILDLLSDCQDVISSGCVLFGDKYLDLMNRINEVLE